LKLEVWGESTIRVLYSTGTAAPAETGSLAVNEVRPVTPFTISETDAALTVTITASKLSAHVDKTTGQVSFLNPSGTAIFSESASNPHQLAPATGGVGPYVSTGTFTPNAGDMFYGLGEHQQQQGGKLAYANGSIQMTQQNPGETSIPLLVSSGGYGILWDNPSVTTFTIGSNLVVKSQAVPFIDYYFMAGSPDDIVGAFRALTGPAPMFGRWVFGYWQSHDHYGSQNELLATAAKYRSMQIPVDNIVQDWQYWGSNPWGSHMFDSSYPDPAGMFSTLHQTGFHAMISVWARFDIGNYNNYNQLKAANALLTPGSGSFTYYDPFSSQGRSIYWQQMDSELFTKGVDGWWLDSDEPGLGSAWTTDALGPQPLVANAFPLMTTTAVYTGQRAATADKRVFILTRSAYSGQQRNAAATWSGDINGDWPTFARQIPGLLNMSASSIPYVTNDIGGYYLNPPSPGFGNAAYTELFERWFQFGGFLPIFRTHGSGPDRDIYAFGADAQTVLEGVDELRYRLLPYIYSLSWMVSSQAYTMMRGFVFDFGADPKALSVADQFMFGPALMVNPVTAPNVTTRSLYLPANTTWYDFWTGASQAGGQTISSAAPIDHLPLFVRAGSILPLGPALQYSTEKPSDPTELRVYKGADGAFTLYEDENDNYNYEKGMYATIPITWDDAKKTLHIGARNGSFPGMLMSRTFQVVFVDATHGSGTAPSATIDKTVPYTGTAVDVSAP
ncbi:MAG TPA: TIM-barrel domain-containing protein, partial [Polyangiaceae bacterium]